MFDFTLTMENLTFQCTKCKRNIKKINLLLAMQNQTHPRYQIQQGFRCSTMINYSNDLSQRFWCPTSIFGPIILTQGSNLDFSMQVFCDSLLFTIA